MGKQLFSCEATKHSVDNIIDISHQAMVHPTSTYLVIDDLFGNSVLSTQSQ